MYVDVPNVERFQVSDSAAGAKRVGFVTYVSLLTLKLDTHASIVEIVLMIHFERRAK